MNSDGRYLDGGGQVSASVDGGHAAISLAEPVFVLCAGRSGSTLLRFLLDAHPELACPPETRIPWLCKQLASTWAVVEDAPPSDGTDGQGPVLAEPVAAGLRRSLEPVMAAYLDRTGKRRFCD